MSLPVAAMQQLINSAPLGSLDVVLQAIRTVVREDELFFRAVSPMCLRYHIHRVSVFALPSVCLRLSTTDMLDEEMVPSMCTRRSNADVTCARRIRTSIAVCRPGLATSWSNHLVTWIVLYVDACCRHNSSNNKESLCSANQSERYHNFGVNAGICDTSETTTHAEIARAVEQFFRMTPSDFVADEDDADCMNSAEGRSRCSSENDGQSEEDIFGNIAPSYGFEVGEHIFIDETRRLFIEVDPLSTRCVRTIAFDRVTQLCEVGMTHSCRVEPNESRSGRVMTVVYGGDERAPEPTVVGSVLQRIRDVRTAVRALLQILQLPSSSSALAAEDQDAQTAGGAAAAAAIRQAITAHGIPDWKSDYADEGSGGRPGKHSHCCCCCSSGPCTFNSADGNAGDTMTMGSLRARLYAHLCAIHAAESEPAHTTSSTFCTSAVTVSFVPCACDTVVGKDEDINEDATTTATDVRSRTSTGATSMRTESNDAVSSPGEWALHAEVCSMWQSSAGEWGAFCRVTVNVFLTKSFATSASADANASGSADDRTSRDDSRPADKCEEGGDSSSEDVCVKRVCSSHVVRKNTTLSTDSPWSAHARGVAQMYSSCGCAAVPSGPARECAGEVTMLHRRVATGWHCHTCPSSYCCHGVGIRAARAGCESRPAGASQDTPASIKRVSVQEALCEDVVRLVCQVQSILRTELGKACGGRHGASSLCHMRRRRPLSGMSFDMHRPSVKLTALPSSAHTHAHLSA